MLTTRELHAGVVLVVEYNQNAQRVSRAGILLLYMHTTPRPEPCMPTPSRRREFGRASALGQREGRRAKTLQGFDPCLFNSHYLLRPKVKEVKEAANLFSKCVKSSLQSLV
jgi:hypothetical protein